jgi:hypothetical protein
MTAAKTERPQAEAERPMVAVSRDRFDYTEWRRQGLPRMELEELAQAADLVSKQLDQGN